MPYQLFICRHAQAQDPDFTQTDLERPLTQKGVTEAEQAGNWLQKLAVNIDLIVCSSARRTYNTALIIADKVSYNHNNIVRETALYNAPEAKLLSYLAKMNKINQSILLVGHNPGVSDLVSNLSNTYRGSVPTGSIHQLRFEMQDWSDLYDTTAQNYTAYLGDA